MELIKITENNGVKVVSARELHLFLEIETRIDTWVNRMMSYGFVDNVDCSKVSVENQQVDYALSIECAKHWSMIQRSEKGMLARNYFIECEKKLINQLPQDYLSALKALVASEELKQIAENKIKELQPKADVFDKISDAENLLDMNKVAKTVGYGRNTFFKMLREDKILQSNNTPYQKFIDLKIFEIKVSDIQMGDYIKNVITTYVTGKGLTWLTERYAKE